MAKLSTRPEATQVNADDLVHIVQGGVSKKVAAALFAALTSVALTGPITALNNVTSVASQTGSGSTFVMSLSPTLTTPNIGAATASSISMSGNLTFTQSGFGIVGNPTEFFVNNHANTFNNLFILDNGNTTIRGTLAAANISGTNTGDQTSVSGNAGTATRLQTPRLIGGSSFDGTADITVVAVLG